MDEIQALLFTILRHIVYFPDDVKVRVAHETDSEGEITTFYVKVNDSDVGLCIGKGGENAEAIRTVMRLIGHKVLNARLYTKIEAPRR